jgi:U3 small nucleolar RNA-associated protein 10
MSSLQRQLQRAVGDAPRATDRAKPSLLFGPREAADIGVDTIHQIARNGLLELERMDERFAPCAPPPTARRRPLPSADRACAGPCRYSNTLFAEATKRVNREGLDRTAEIELDKGIGEFIVLLGGFLLLRPAHKALEYLIRVYRANEFNKDALLLAALPYHASRTFGLLARLCLGKLAGAYDRAGPHWTVLDAARRKGMPVDRNTLVAHCAGPTGLGLLTAVAEHLQTCSRRRVYSRAHASFYAALLVETLALRRPTDTLLQRLLPFVAHGLRAAEHPDYLAATLAITAQVAAASTLVPPVREALIDAVAATVAAAEQPRLRLDALRCAVAVCQAQRPDALSARAARRLASVHGLPELLVDLGGGGRMAQPTDLAPLLAPLFAALIRLAFEAPAAEFSAGDEAEAAEAVLAGLVEKLDVGPLAATLTESLLQACAAAPEAQASAGTAQRLLRALELRHGGEVEQGVTRFAAATPVAGAALPPAEVVRMCTTGARQQLVKGAGTTLMLALQHTALSVRLLGVAKLSEAMEACAAAGEDAEPAARAFLRDCLVLLLGQTEPEVRRKVYKLPSLFELAERPLLLDALEETMAGDDVRAKAQALTLAAELLHSEYAADAGLPARARCLRLVVAALLATAGREPRTHRAAVAAAGSAGRVVPLLVGCGGLPTAPKQARKLDKAGRAAAKAEAKTRAKENGGVGKGRKAKPEPEPEPAPESAPAQDPVKMRRDHIQALVARMAGNLAAEGGGGGPALRDAELLAQDGASGLGALGLLVLSAGLTVCGEPAAGPLAACVMRAAARRRWGGRNPRKLQSGALPPCWAAGEVAPPRAVVNRLLRVGAGDAVAPYEVLLHALHAVAARLPGVAAASFPTSLVPAVLHLPLGAAAGGGEEQLGDSEKEDDWVTIDATTQQMDGITIVEQVEYVDGDDAGDLAAQLAASEGGVGEPPALDGGFTALASAFTVATALLEPCDAAPVLQVLVAHHLLPPAGKRGGSAPGAESGTVVLDFARLFWTPGFSATTQLYAAQLALALAAAGGAPAAAALQQQVGRLLLTLHQLSHPAVRGALFAVLGRLAELRPTPGASLPAGILQALVTRRVAVESTTGHLPTLLLELLAPPKDEADAALVSAPDRLAGLTRLATLATEGGAAGCPAEGLALLRLIRGPLLVTVGAGPAQPALLAVLRGFAQCAVAGEAPPTAAGAAAVGLAFEVLAAAAARPDARKNLPLVQAALDQSPRAYAADPRRQAWLEVLWVAALRCVNSTLVPATDVHAQTEVLRLLLAACVRADVHGAAHIREAISGLPLAAQAVVPCLPAGGGVESESESDDEVDALFGGGKSKNKGKRPAAGKRAQPAAARRASGAAGAVKISSEALVMLEVLQQKRDLAGPTSVLVPPLFAMLRAELADDGDGDDYTKQLVLSALQWIALAGVGDSQADDRAYDVGALVDCMRGTTNPSTRNHTLVLLSAIATLSPKTVVSRVVPVFTSMGASAVQVEDSYSMSVIQQILRTVVPPIVADGGGDAVRQLVQVLIDAVPGTPAHRRIPLFASLVSVLRPTDHLHGVLLQFITADAAAAPAAVRPDGSSPRSSASLASPKAAAIAGGVKAEADGLRRLAHELCAQYSAAEQLLAVSHLVDVLLSGGLAGGGAARPEGVPPLENSYAIATVEGFAGLPATEQLGLALSVVKFGSAHLADRAFLKKLLRESAEAQQSDQPEGSAFAAACLRLFKLVLVYLRHVIESRRQLADSKSQKREQREAGRLVRQLEGAVVSFLSATQQLLPPAGLLEGVASLLGHTDHKVRHRALTLFKDVLQSPEGAQQPEAIVAVMPALGGLLVRADAGSEAAGDSETPPNKQLVLICIGLLCKLHGVSQPQAFAPLVPTVAEAALHPNLQLAASALLCLGSLGAEFGPLLLPQLRLLVDRLLQGLTLGGRAGRTPLMVVSALSGLNVLAHHMPQFLGPHVGLAATALLDRSLLAPPEAADSLEWAAVPLKAEQTLALLTTQVRQPTRSSGSGRAHMRCVTEATGTNSHLRQLNRHC